MKRNAFLLILFLSVLSACGGAENQVPTDNTAASPQPAEPTTPTEGSTLKQIGQQRSGDYLITLFNETGVVKQGPNRFVLEIRNASSSELVPVNNLHVESTMEMKGQAPMIGGGSAVPGNVPGRYEIGSDFGERPAVGDDVSSPRAGRMAGQWKLVVTFDPKQRAEFAANVE